MPDIVNSQITDAVTQSTRAAQPDAPGLAVGSIYQSLAHSTGMLFENAVAQQQQAGISAQAATNQGVIQIYSIDTAAGAASAGKRSEGAEALRSHVSETAKAAGHASTTALHASIEAALRSAAEAGHAHGADVAYAVRASADALAAALRALDAALHDQLMKTVQLAATAMCLEAMVRDPTQAAAYEAILKSIRTLE
jgi:hypothetical protein